MFYNITRIMAIQFAIAISSIIVYLFFLMYDTRVHRYASSGDIVSLQGALDGGADLNGKDSKGRTPLHWAVYAKKEQIVSELVYRGAQLNIPDDYGELPIHLCYNYYNSVAESTRILTALIDAGSCVNFPSPVRGRIIEDAAHMEDVEGFVRLLSAGACLDFTVSEPFRNSAAPWLLQFARDLAEGKNREGRDDSIAQRIKQALEIRCVNCGC